MSLQGSFEASISAEAASAGIQQLRVRSRPLRLERICCRGLFAVDAESSFVLVYGRELCCDMPKRSDLSK